MDKASAYGAGDCRFESCRGHSFLFAITKPACIQQEDPASEAKATARGFEPLRAEPNGFLVHHLNHSVTLS